MKPRSHLFLSIARKPSPLLAALLLSSCLGAASGCRSEENRDQERRLSVERGMKALLDKQLTLWEQASRELQEAAPTPPDRGWDLEQDGAAIARMKEAWARAREAYELIEGAIAPTFPESDAATDARYDDFLLKIGPVGDRTPFDGEGVVGMHAIERVLWANTTPEAVIDFEKGLPGYQPARQPESAEEAAQFKRELAGRLVRDIEKLRADFTPLTLDVAFAFQGLIDLAAEQSEKVDRAATGQEESRYAQSTMSDLRANHRGCLDAYRVFQPWVLDKKGGKELDRAVLDAFARLEAAYARVQGASIPAPPEGWSSLSPRPEHAETPFGRLFLAVQRESDPEIPASLAHSLSAVAKLLELRDVAVR